MRKFLRGNIARFLCLILMTGILTPRRSQAMAPAMALPLAGLVVPSGGTGAFALTLSGGPVTWAVVGGALVVGTVGYAAYRYYKNTTEEFKDWRKINDLVRRGEDLVRHFDHANESDEVTPIVPVISPAKIVSNVRVGTRSKAVPRARSGEADSVAESSQDSGIPSELTTPVMDWSVPMKFTYSPTWDTPPPKVFELERYISPQTLQHLMNSSRYEYAYDRSLRYGESTKWAAYNPDALREWVKNPSNQKFDQAVRQIQDQANADLRKVPQFSATVEAARIDQVIPKPMGVSAEAATAELVSIELARRNLSYHQMVEEIGVLRQSARDIRNIGEQADLADFWEQNLQRSFITPDGVLRGLPFIEGLELPNTDVGIRAASLISHTLLVKKTVELGWSYRAIRDGLLDLTKPEVQQRVQRIAHSTDIFNLLTDQYIDDLIRMGRGQSTVFTPASAESIGASLILLGQALEQDEGIYEDQIDEWSRKEVKELYPNIKVVPSPDATPEEIEEFKNWRKAKESIRRGEEVTEEDWSYGSPPDIRAETDDKPAEKPTEETTPPETKPEDTAPPEAPPATEAPGAPAAPVTPPSATKTPVDAPAVPKKKTKFTLSQIREVLKKVGPLRDRFGNRFKIVNIESSEEGNASDAAKNGYSWPGIKGGGVVITVRTLEPLRLVRSHQDGEFTFEDNKYYGDPAILKNSDGSDISPEEYKKIYSIPAGNKRIATVEFGPNREIRISLTNQELGGLGDQAQYQVPKPDPENDKILDDRPF